MINKKILGLIGLSARAKKIACGANNVERQIENKKIYLLIIALDASENTKNKFVNLGKKNNVNIIIDGEIADLSKAIGKENKAIIGIEDINISKEIIKIKDGGDIIG